MLTFPVASENVKEFLDYYVDQINTPGFIDNDPISIPHTFSKLQDIEISAFFAAILAWGNRKTIINKTKELLLIMDNAPYDFIMNHAESDLKNLKDFKHRTFQLTDTLYFLDFLKRHYHKYSSLESAFYNDIHQLYDQESALKRFHNYFFDMPYAPQRTKKHISTPIKKSTCKRLNMFLRWMVRKDKSGVDFGIWNTIPASALMIPLDVHVENIARKLKLIQRPQRDWQTVTELTSKLRAFDPEDPVKYDFALFGIGALKLL